MRSERAATFHLGNEERRVALLPRDKGRRRRIELAWLLSESRSELVGSRAKWHQMPHEARFSRHKVRDWGVVSRFQLWLVDLGWFCADLHRCLFMHYIN